MINKNLDKIGITLLIIILISGFIVLKIVETKEENEIQKYCFHETGNDNCHYEKCMYEFHPSNYYYVESYAICMIKTIKENIK